MTIETLADIQRKDKRRASVILELGWCKFGVVGGLIPEVRLGLIRFAWCRGSIIDKFWYYQTALTESWNELQMVWLKPKAGAAPRSMPEPRV